MDAKDKKILFIISTLKLGGGAERVVSTIGSELYNKGYDVHFLTFYDFKEKYSFKGKYYCLNEKYSNLLLLKFYKLFIRAFKIKKYCKKNKINTVISFMDDSIPSAILSKTIFNNNSKIIGSIRINPEVYKKDLFFWFLIKKLYNKANKIICVSRGVEEILKEKYFIKNTKTIYNPINFEFIDKLKNERISEKNLFNKKNFVFINMGRLDNQKGQVFLIKAFKKIIEKKYDAKLIILGEGSLRKKLEKLINNLELEEHVFLLGNKKNIYKYISNSDCFILSSLFEGLPNTLIEAASLNKYCISTDCKTGPREILFPEININKKINYPLRKENCVLINSNENIIESQLLKEMLFVLKSKKQKFNNKYIYDLFDIKKIVGEWEKLL